MFDIEIIGSIDEGEHYSLGSIHDLLAFDAETLLQGNDFVGRPGTRIHAGKQDVVKIRTELNFTPIQSKRWIIHALEKERLLGVYHPHKTWLLITEQVKDAAPLILIANICPRLKPLHIELKFAPETKVDRDLNFMLLRAVLKMYLTLAKTTNYKLDEGLSNFAVSSEGVVYYLDDEYYSWDNFVSFSIMLGVYIRGFDWLDTAFISDLGRALIELLDEIFQETHCRVIIARQLQSLFMPSEKKELLVQVLINILMPKISNTSKELTISIQHQVPERFFALLADVHSNYSALSTVLDYLKCRNINQGIVLGDIVGYGPEPNECIERLQSTGFQIIKGNHDHAVAINSVKEGFSENSKAVINWTIAQLSTELREWLNSLPVLEENERWLAVHGAPMDPALFYGYVYVMTYQDNLDYMQEKNISLCFHGHSHMPGAFVRDKHNQDHHLTGQKIDLRKYTQALVCPGSVGQPRNGCTHTQFAIYDNELHEVSFITLPYNVDSVVGKIRQNDLPEVLAQRLLTGR